MAYKEVYSSNPEFRQWLVEAVEEVLSDWPEEPYHEELQKKLKWVRMQIEFQEIYGYPMPRVEIESGII